MYVYIYIRKLPALHGLVSHVFVARHATARGKQQNLCTALHGPACKAAMHGFAWTTCKWIPNFTGLNGTALRSLFIWIITWHRLGSSMQHDAAHGKRRAPLHGFAWTSACTDLHGPAQI